MGCLEQEAEALNNPWQQPRAHFSLDTAGAGGGRPALRGQRTNGEPWNLLGPRGGSYRWSGLEYLGPGREEGSPATGPGARTAGQRQRRETQDECRAEARPSSCLASDPGLVGPRGRGGPSTPFCA